MDCEYGDSRNGKLVWQVGKDCVLDEEDEGAEGRVLVEVRQPSQVEGESFPQPQACELRTHIALPRQKGGICPRRLPDQQHLELHQRREHPLQPLVRRDSRVHLI